LKGNRKIFDFGIYARESYGRAVPLHINIAQMPDSDYDAVAQLIRETRSDAGLKQTELALKLGVAQSVVSKFETGERRLDLIEVRAVCSACGVTLEQFVARLEARLGRRPDARA
jgi:ribosome-binding protein aMBF1 (putative translation factor)